MSSHSYQTILLETVDSTSRYLKQYLVEKTIDRPVVCITQQQTAGYGQQKRSWMTNRQSAIFSIALPIEKSLLLSAHSSLKIAALLHQCLLEEVDGPLFLKWPNDLYDLTGKVAGILIEQVVQKNRRFLVIGIGINRGQMNADLADYQASALPMFATESLVSCLMTGFENLDFAAEFSLDQQAYWQANDLFQLGETIEFVTKNESRPALYLGLNQQGQAELEMDSKTIQLSSGINSIRKFRHP